MARQIKNCDDDAKPDTDTKQPACVDFYVQAGYFEYVPYRSGPQDPGFHVWQYTRYIDNTSETTELARFKLEEDASIYLARKRGVVNG